ncbi:sensor histidine kinase [Actinoplanes sp. NPDC049599]|uniref:sensor histidine kinase n=1 Tax=Actinoplanes sp. NPDC049599 TaxID=3363903 RepID=UPI003790C9C1
MHDLLRSVWDEPRPPHPPTRVWRDWALVAVLVPLAVLEALLRPELPWRVVSAGLVLALIPTLLWRRTRPLLMITIGFGVSGLAPVVFPGATLETYSIAFLLILPYALLRWGSGREIVLGAAVILGKVGLGAAAGQLGVADLGAGFAILSCTGALGLALRWRARARQRELEQVKLLERERLARDLHDTVAHHVSAMAIRAQAGLATAPTDPAAATDALRVIEAEASRALAEMRGMVRVLRHDPPTAPAPDPGLADLTALAGQGRAGPPVEVDITGDLADLPAPVRTAIFRIAQESVTNARRHARHAGRIQVRVSTDPTSVRLQVTDDGSGPRATRPTGYGLIGMAERAGLLGGTCEAGPGPDRGWTVTAVLPRSGSAA